MVGNPRFLSQTLKLDGSIGFVEGRDTKLVSISNINIKCQI